MNALRFFEAVYADDAARAASERRRRIPDLLRYARGTVLRPLDRVLAESYSRRGQPIIFIVGAPRSGTTLLYQLLARHFALSYVCNEVARSWQAPLAGAIWTSWRHGGLRPSRELDSRYGRTSGPMGPHEFSWFWHYWGDFFEHDDLRGVELDRVDWSAIALRLRGLAGFYRAPLVLKSINFTNYQVEILARRIPEARFLWISRDPLYCAQSILEVRLERYADRNRWWSVRPRDFRAWSDRPAEDQVVHQIRDIEDALSTASSSLEDGRLLRVRYEDLVESTRPTLSRIARFLGVAVVGPIEPEELSLKNRNEISMTTGRLHALQRALGDDAHD